MNPVFGMLAFALGGLAGAVFAVPFRKVKGWAYESYWLVYAVAGLVVFPAALAFATVPDLCGVIAKTPAATLAGCAGYGALWGIVQNAGICRDVAFPGMTAESWDAVIHTNLDGFYNVIQPLVMPMCRQKKGRIITIASVSGVMGNRGQVNYSASKAGIIGATKALAVELAKRKITVNCIAPGVIETEMIKDAPLDMILPTIPMQRAGKPEEIASAAVFLLSEGASYITRQVINVNGGII